VDVQTGKEVHNVKGTRAVTVTGNETHTNKADFKQRSPATTSSRSPAIW
jgi:type VI secretion system secreted protein VgrG